MYEDFSMNKVTIAIICGFLGIINGIFICLLFLQFCQGKFVKQDGVVEFSYYIMSSIGVIATVSAVIVALFGNELRNLLFREKCDVSLENQNFVEIIKDEEMANIEAIRYDCNVLIKNIGSKTIDNCKLYLEKIVSKKTESNPKDKEIKLQNRRPIFIDYQSKTKLLLLPNETRTVSVLKIFPAVNDTTPLDGTATVVNPSHLEIIGYSSNKNKNNRCGKWEIIYCLTSSKAELFRFALLVSWTGQWKNRETEMNNELNIEFKRIK